MKTREEVFEEKRIFYEELCKEYNGNIKDLIYQASDNIVREEFSTGGDIHRGYYCPSPILDMVIGNCHRGRLLKVVRKNSKPSQRYCYDQDGRLILVYGYAYELEDNLGDIELLIYLDKYVLSFICNPDLEKSISGISICRYMNGKIKSYEYASIDTDLKCSEIRTEEYTYEEGILAESLYEHKRFVNESEIEWVKNIMAGWRKFRNEEIAEAFAVERMRYFFVHDQDGYIIAYTTKEYIEGMEKESVWDGHIFEVSKSKQRIV